MFRCSFAKNNLEFLNQSPTLIEILLGGCNLQVYPTGWSAVMVSLDNKGMWNLRSAIWSRRYLGQQLYIRVWNDEHSVFTENDIPLNALFCGKAKHR